MSIASVINHLIDHGYMVGKNDKEYPHNLAVYRRSRYRFLLTELEGGRVLIIGERPEDKRILEPLKDDVSFLLN